MVRLVGRSRGCKACLKRRIKCDEKLPECTQCESRGNKCPGATVGAVFVSMDPKPKKKPRAKGKTVSNVRRESSVLSEDPGSNFSGPSSRAITPIPPSGNAASDSSLSTEFLLPTSYQPSKAAPFGQLFLDHFISSFDSHKILNSPAGSWFEYLPAIYNASSYESCQDSTRATMMIHYGVMTGDMSIQTEAYRWYAKALGNQRKIVQSDTTGLPKNVPAAEEIISPIVLTLFELVSSTTPTGWMNHVMGAATMLQMRGPKGCRTGLAHLLFRTTRPIVVYMTMTTEEQHPFATYPWDTVPFEINPKTTYDKLLDILLFLPGCLSLENKLKRMSSADKIEEKRLRLELITMISGILRRLRSWWQVYVDEQAGLGGNANSFGEPNLFSISGEPYFPNSFAAACTAAYHAANIVIYKYLAVYSGEMETYEAETAWHSNRILASCSYMITNQTPCSGVVMMVFPLKIMWRCCKDPVHRQAAIETLETWGEKMGIGGICTQAAPRFGIPITIGNSIPQYFSAEKLSQG